MASHNQPLTLVSTHRATIVPDEWAAEHAQVEEYEPRVYTEDGMWAMPSARAAPASQPSLLRVSGIAGIAIAALCIIYFGAEFLR